MLITAITKNLKLTWLCVFIRTCDCNKEKPYLNSNFCECAKFRGSHAIVGLVGLVPSYLRGYLVDQKIFLMGI